MHCINLKKANDLRKLNKILVFSTLESFSTNGEAQEVQEESELLQF
jgi:hypothetical protein